MRRRNVVALLGAAILAAPAWSDERVKPARIGYLWIGARGSDEKVQIGLRRGFADRGYVVGRNLVIEERYADGHPERLPELIAELLALKVEVLVAAGTQVARAAKQATNTMPIVTVAGDPVAAGLATSLSHPGGNVTGISLLSAEYSAKWLQLLKEAVPAIKRVAVLQNPDARSSTLEVARMEQVARGLDLELRTFSGRPAEIDASLAEIAGANVDGLVVSTDPFLDTLVPRIIIFAAERRLPALYAFSDSVRRGGLMSYAANLSDAWWRAAGYVDRILEGARPAELPIEQATIFTLAINLNTAKALGLTISDNLLALADEVIE